MKTRICHILFNSIAKLPPVYHELRSLSAGGLETLVYEVVNEEEPFSFPLDVPHVHIVSARVLLRSLSTRQTSIWKLLRFTEYMLRVFFFVLFRSRCRIIVAHDLPAALPSWCAARLSGKKLVYNAHEIWGESNGITAPFPALWRLLDRFLCPRVDAMVTPEANRARMYREEYRARIEPLVVPNAPPYQPRVASSTLRDFARARGAQADIIVLYQGIFDASRCLLELVEAMTMTPAGMILVLAGRGSTKQFDAIQDTIVKFGLEKRVLIHPFVPYDRLHAFTCSADVGVLLYRNDCRNNEYCAPNKVFEYMHAGLPIVCSMSPGISSLIEMHGIGFSVDAESSASIAAALTRLGSQELRAEMSSRLLELSKNLYHWDLGFSRVFELYRSL